MTVATELSLDQARKLAKDYAGSARTHFGERLRVLKLYGSAARGDWSKDSDIDVLVVLDRVAKDDSDWLVEKAFSSGVLGHGVVIQPVFMSEADFQKLKSRERRFAIEVEKEGVAL